MKLPLSTYLSHKRHSSVGSILMITMFVIMILAFVLGGYMYIVKQESAMVTRSQAWNAALLIAEAGIEEGMAQINSGFGTNNMWSANGNGWSGPSGSGVYGPKTISWNNARYVSSIMITGLSPVITATGYVTIPSISATVSRTVQLQAAPTPAFIGGMVALQNVTLNGNNIYIDSFDSTDPKYSTNGLYVHAWRKAGGSVASTYGKVDIGNAEIKGQVSIGASGSWDVGPNGSAGDLNWNGPGIQPGWLKNDFNATFPDVSVPYTSGFSLPAGTGTNTYALSGNTRYMASSLTLNAGDTLYVAGPNAELYITGDLKMNSGGQKTSMITIAAGASLKIYVGGSASFTMVNTVGTASTFQYYGLPTNTQVTWGGNSTYVGTVYAPEASFTLGGSGNNTYDYQGACVVKSVTMNGHFNFHYDESLKNKIYIGYSGSWWKEL